MIEIQLYRFSIICNGKVNLSFVVVNNPAIVIGVSMIEIQLYRFSIICNGKVNLPLVVVNNPAIVIGDQLN